MGEITEKGQGATELWRGRIVGFYWSNILLKPEASRKGRKGAKKKSQEVRGEVALSGGTENCMFRFRDFFYRGSLSAAMPQPTGFTEGHEDNEEGSMVRRHGFITRQCRLDRIKDRGFLTADVADNRR
jgi:hypothetical protein